MIDLKALADDGAYSAGAIRKGFDAADVDKLIQLNNDYRTSLAGTEALRAESNAMSKAIGKAAPEEREAKIAEAGEFKAKLQTSEEAMTILKGEMESLALMVPNPAHESVPDGGEDDYRVEKEVGEQTPEPKFNHAELGEHLGLVDTKRAVAMSGSRFAYVLGDAVRLQFALVQWMMDRLSKHNFVPAVVPVLVREEMMVDAGFFPGDRDSVYELERDELFLVGTSEVGLAGLHRGERLDVDNLPLR
jgi:seryl-tRNA synthetase